MTATPATEPSAVAPAVPIIAPEINQIFKIVKIFLNQESPAPAATKGAAKPPVRPIKAPPPAVANDMRAYLFNLLRFSLFLRSSW